MQVCNVKQAIHTFLSYSSNSAFDLLLWAQRPWKINQLIGGIKGFI